MPAERFTTTLQGLADIEAHADAWDNQITAVQLIGKDEVLVTMTLGKTIPNKAAEIIALGLTEVPDI